MPNLESRRKTLEEKIDFIHDSMIKYHTLWNGGPGTWPPCQQHTAELLKIQKVQNWTVRLMLLVIGGGVVISFLIEHQQLLKLLAKP